MQWLSLFNGKCNELDNVSIVSVKRNGYSIQFWCMSKDEAIRIMNNTKLTKTWTIVRYEKF